MSQAILYMMVGISGSGKTTVARDIARTHASPYTYPIVFSSDDIREELYGDANCQDNPSKVFALLHARIWEHLRSGEVAIYDATNLSAKRRKAFLTDLANQKIDCKKICVVVPTHHEVCKARQSMRDRQVPDEVVDRQLRQFEAPYYNEGWDLIMLRYTDSKTYSLGDLIMEARDIPHDNPHHSATIGDHCDNAANYIEQKCGRDAKYDAVMLAAAFHDIGKPLVKQFKNAKGEDTDIAHYYSHESVSSYVFLGSEAVKYDTEHRNRNLFAASLIQNHMKYFAMHDDEEKMTEWFDKRGFSHQYARMLALLHEADIAAH